MQSSDLAPSIYAMADVNVIPLAPNIYRTALPSKTATCIACQKPIIFCFGNQSRFEKRVSDQEGYYVTDSSNAAELVNAILNIKKSHPQLNVLKLYTDSFLRSVNSKKYSDMIIENR